MTCKLVVFDLDGTLADSFDTFRICLDEAAAEHGFRSLAGEDTQRIRRMSSRQLMDHLGVPIWKVPTLAVDMRRRMFARIDAIRPFPGADATLRRLHDEGFALALLTSNTRDAASAVLGADTLALFQHLHCRTSLFGKRFKLRELLWTTRLAPQSVTCIGDEIRDADAARAVGMGFLGVAWGYTHPEALQAHCDAPLLKTLEALPERLSCTSTTAD